MLFRSFLARAFGSINYNGHRLFCFSALAQSAIALILPGYIILCGSLELQSKSIVAGSVRMFYAVIYSLFLGFGITIGTAFYGAMDGNAVSDITCREPMTQYGKLPPHLLLPFILTLTSFSPFPLRPPLHHVSLHHQPSKMETNPSDDFNLVLRVPR